MRIGLVDVDNHNYPNIALMKLSAFHKAKGDFVEFATPLNEYDIVYKAKVFDFTEDDATLYNAKQVIYGGTGRKILYFLTLILLPVHSGRICLHNLPTVRLG